LFSGKGFSLKLLIILAFIFSFQRAFADSKIEEDGLFLNPSLLYWGDSSDYQTKRARSYFLGSLTGGFKRWGLFFGMTYDYSTEKWVDSGGSTEGDYVWTRTSWGPTFGAAYKIVYCFVTYYFFSELKDKRPGAGEITYKDGDGYQVSLGTQIQITETFFLAPQLSYRAFRYRKSNQDGRDSNLTRTNTKTSLDPFLALFFYF
jgi:hypothetical protein